MHLKKGEATETAAEADSVEAAIGDSLFVKSIFNSWNVVLR